MGTMETPMRFVSAQQTRMPESVVENLYVVMMGLCKLHGIECSDMSVKSRATGLTYGTDQDGYQTCDWDGTCEHVITVHTKKQP